MMETFMKIVNSENCPNMEFFLVRIFLYSDYNGDLITAWKVSKYGVFSGPYFPAFRLNTDIYSRREKCQNSEFFLVRIFLYSG